jgi:hypothetical protein
MKTISLKNSTVHIRKDGILHIHIKAHADLQLEDAVEIVETIGKIGNGKKFPVLIDAGEFANVDKEARIFSASKESNIYTIADAIAYHSFAQKLVANFYLKHNHPVVPTKVFPEKAEAITWLKHFVKN